jgi:hypothetical protein
MARRELEGEDLGNLIKFTQYGQTLEGIYQGSRMVSGNFGPQTIYDVKGNDGVVYSVAGSAGLNGKIGKAVAGQAIWITYVADREIGLDRDGKPKNPMKVFKVEVDDVKPGAKAPF